MRLAHEGRDVYTTRLLTEGDATEFLRLRLEGLQNDPQAFGSSWEEEHTRTPEDVRPRLHSQPEGSFSVGAFMDDRLIGIAVFVRSDRLKTRHRGDIYGVYVTPGERGQGVGRALLRHLLERVRGYSDLEQVCLSVAATQIEARNLYESLGFEVYGYERHALKIGDRYVDEEHCILWLTAEV